MNKLLSFLFFSFFFFTARSALLLGFSREASSNTYELTHKHTHTHTNVVPHTGQLQAPHQHLYQCKCLPTQNCILWEHAHALTAARTVRACNVHLWRGDAFVHKHTHTHTFVWLSHSPACYNEYWVIQRAPLQWVSWPVHVGSCLLWERRRFKGEHGSQQIHWNYCTEETSSGVSAKHFTSAGFSQSCWHNIFTLIYKFTKISQIWRWHVG